MRVPSIFLTGLLLSFLCPAVATGQVTITLGSIPTAANQESVEIPIYLSGGGQISDVTAYFQIGDGGILFGGSAGPKITRISFEGSVWENAPGGFSSSATFTGTGNGTPTQLEEVFVSLDVGGQSVAADGLLCTLIIDTRGFSEGEFPLAMKNVYPPGNTTSTEFSRGGTVVEADIDGNGKLVIGTPPPLVIPTVTIDPASGDAVRLRFDSQVGFQYLVQWKDSLSAAQWTTINSPLSGTGTHLTWTDDGTATGTHPSTVPTRFYRLNIP